MDKKLKLETSSLIITFDKLVDFDDSFLLPPLSVEAVI